MSFILVLERGLDGSPREVTLQGSKCIKLCGRGNIQYLMASTQMKIECYCTLLYAVKVEPLFQNELQRIFPL